jgi:hypothetical protein
LKLEPTHVGCYFKSNITTMQLAAGHALLSSFILYGNENGFQHPLPRTLHVRWNQFDLLRERVERGEF